MNPENVIPIGPYCYTFISALPDMKGIKIKCCPYWKDIDGSIKCEYMGIVDDICLDDQVKVCNVNHDDSGYFGES